MIIASTGVMPMRPRRPEQSKAAIGANQTLLDGFVQNGSLPATDDAQMPRAVNDNHAGAGLCL